MFDQNDDGCITSNELTIVMRSLGQNPTHREVMQLVSDVDTDSKTNTHTYNWYLGYNTGAGGPTMYSVGVHVRVLLCRTTVLRTCNNRHFIRKLRFRTSKSSKLTL